MTISYNWLSEYLPEKIEPEKLSKILTSIGLEVESLEAYESIKGGLQGLVIGEVVTCEQHPNADKLRVTTVNVGELTPLQIVCGAPNVAVGQKVVVATVGTTIYPLSGDPLTMKVAKIRGVESYGMICAEDEIGIGGSHAGIMVLPSDLVPGTPASSYFEPYSDYIYEIGLTPNRMDAMSHWGVAKDVCAYLSYHNQTDTRAILPATSAFSVENQSLPFSVEVENTQACLRYCGVTISGVTVGESPKWLKNKLLAIGQRPINNIVDITNYILHETGQPLHAFDAATIAGNKIVVGNLPEGTSFTTLDDKERKLSANDLMICDGNHQPLCIAGVFGGAQSGVKDTTTQVFLESACFHSVSIRKTSFFHGLRTDAATRFEKGVDVSNTLQVLKRAALLIKQVTGGTISSDLIDVYPQPKEKVEVVLKNHYLKKLSGKHYHSQAVKRILFALGFELVTETLDAIIVKVPYSKPDISLPADIVEEIVRIDGLDNIEIPNTITITPASESLSYKEAFKEKIANYLVGLGFNEIVTNSITNSKYYSNEVLNGSVKMMNNLSADLDVLRPSMLETGLETMAYNYNRKQANLRLFEYGKTYHQPSEGQYAEKEHLAIYLTGNTTETTWNTKAIANDFYVAKGIMESVLGLLNIQNYQLAKVEADGNTAIQAFAGKNILARLHIISSATLQAFDLKQAVYFIDFEIESLLKLTQGKKIVYKEVAKFPQVQRDLALVVPSSTTYEMVEGVVRKAKLGKLNSIRLFDIFESEKLGNDKKSLAINFSFLDEEKTLTDKEIDSMVSKLISGFEAELQAEIRK